MSFNGWLEENKPDYLVLLEYIKTFETIKEQILDLKDVQKERQQYEEWMQDDYQPNLPGN